MVQKKSKKRSTNLDLDLYAYIHIKQGLSPSHIAKKLSISKTRLEYHISSLKKRNLIRKIGYGVWEVVGNYEKRSTNHQLHLTPHQPCVLTPNLVRGHAFKFIFALPKNLRNWDKRESLLARLKIPFTRLKWFGKSHCIIFQNRKVVLTDKSIVIYEKKSYFADTSTESRSLAVSGMLKLVKSLERHLHANFSHSLGQYRFKVSSQHYSLIKNSLAKQYDEEGNKLYIYDVGEPWLVIDNSYNLHELETLHPRTSVEDNVKVKTFFNGLRRLEPDDCDLNKLINRITNLEKKEHKLSDKPKTKYIG